MNGRAYISGPMRGKHNLNFETFDAAKARWELLPDHTAFSPADHDRAVGYVREGAGHVLQTDRFDIHEAMRADLKAVTECDAIVLLPGYEHSEGAQAELAVARACGLEEWLYAPEIDCIHRLVPARITGLAGYAQTGKDTLGQAFVEQGFTRLGFADALKDTLYDLNPLEGDVHDAGCLQDHVDTMGWDEAKRQDWYSDARVYLQRLGVAVRTHVDEDAWLNAVMRQIEPGGRYVITDVRFPNEFEAIRKAGGEVWRLVRPGFGPVNAHGSETAISEFDFDRYIYNEGSIEDLQGQAKV